MKSLSRIILIGCLVSISWAGAVRAEGTGPSQDIAEVRREFASRCPKPLWWNKVDVSGVQIHTYDDLLKYWQNKERSESQFFKAAYQAVLDNPEDTDIVVNAVKLMYYTRSYRHRTELQEFAMERYFSYRNPDGKPGDSIAGIAIHLGTLYNRNGRYDKSLDLVQRVLKEREPEINDHQLELLHLAYAEALHGQDRDAEAIALLETAVRKYHGSWEERLRETIARYQGAPAASPAESPPPIRKAPVEKEPWWKKNLSGVATLVIILLGFALLKRGDTRGTARSAASARRGPETDAEVERLVRQGRKIDAVKLYREIHGTGLKESKEAIDDLTARAAKTG